eukprot:2264004-Rhodomonas_salina.1
MIASDKESPPSATNLARPPLRPSAATAVLILTNARRVLRWPTSSVTAARSTAASSPLKKSFAESPSSSPFHASPCPEPRRASQRPCSGAIHATSQRAL